MFKNIRHMNTEIREILEKNKTYYTFSFITLVFTFLFFNISLITIKNINNQNSKLSNNYNMKIYVNNNVSQNSIEDIEKNLLAMKDITSVGYEGKELALVLLSKQLGLSSKNIDNPLLNSFDVTVHGEKHLNNLIEKVEGLDGVKEAIINQHHIKILNKRITKNKSIVKFLFFITLIPILIMIFNIMHSTVVSQNQDIKAKYYLGMKKRQILRPYYFINNIKFVSAGIIGGLVFLNLYQLVHTEMPSMSNILSTSRVGVIIGIFLIILSLIFPIISSLFIKVKR